MVKEAICRTLIEWYLREPSETHPLPQVVLT